jgi:hypothetical protein
VKRAPKPNCEGQLCGQCRWFRRAEQDGTEAADFGECLRYPPFVVALHNEIDQLEPISAFPLVETSDFCGEFTARN